MRFWVLALSLALLCAPDGRADGLKVEDHGGKTLGAPAGAVVDSRAPAQAAALSPQALAGAGGLTPEQANELLQRAQAALGENGQKMDLQEFVKKQKEAQQFLNQMVDQD